MPRKEKAAEKTRAPPSDAGARDPREALQALEAMFYQQFDVQPGPTAGGSAEDEQGEEDEEDEEDEDEEGEEGEEEDEEPEPEAEPAPEQSAPRRRVPETVVFGGGQSHAPIATKAQRKQFMVSPS